MLSLNPKFEYLNSKHPPYALAREIVLRSPRGEVGQILNSNFPMFQTNKFGIWNLKHWNLFRISDLVLRIFLSFTFLLLPFTFISKSYALNLDKIKVYFLEGDYKSAISEGEKILADSKPSSLGLDELYYLLGLSYLKDGNYLRAGDIFEIILKEFKESEFREEAKLGIGDIYFLKGDLTRAEEHYKDLVNTKSKLKALVLYRLSQLELKKGNTQAAKAYLDKLKSDFALNPELSLNKDLCAFSGSSASGIYYTVQVGSFSKYANARNLCDRLIRLGYDAYIQELNADGSKTYRVRVGKLSSREDAIRLENKLSQQGYPTKICP